MNDKPIKCSRRDCKKRKDKFCFECDSFPCQSIKTLDERYRKKYGMSEIENLEFIRDHGIDAFLRDQEKKYISKDGTFCVHDGKCYK